MFYFLRKFFRRIAEIMSGKFVKFCFKSFIFCGIIGFFGILFLLVYYGRTLPNYKVLAAYEPPITSRLYAADGGLIEEFAKEKRSFVPIKFIPNHVKSAFIAAEDSNFYNHPGIDLRSILRAAVQNVFRYRDGKNFIGASTITQQVVKNILLTKERTIARKVKEAILALRISKVLDKDRVLELYLNEIYLGYRSFGVAAASLNYFDKALEDLSISEAAFLAALPKAPGALDPKKKYKKALARRNWVIGRMKEDGFITKDQEELAIASPLVIRDKKRSNSFHAGSFGETVRKELVKKFDDETLREGGLVVRGTLDTRYQEIAFLALRKGLRKYDRKHEYRGPVAKIKIDVKDVENAENAESAVEDAEGGELDKKSYVIGEKEYDWVDSLKEVGDVSEVYFEKWNLAAVLVVNGEDNFVNIGFKDGSVGRIKQEHVEWVKKEIEKENPETLELEKYLVKYNNVTEFLNVGDVLLVRKKFVKNSKEEDLYVLRTTPVVSGSVVIMNPHNGDVIAMVGGYNDSKLEFNRAIQAKRQPGSIIKPFTYLTALERNFMPNTIVIDDEVRMKKEDGTDWIPMNYSEKFYGPTPIRMGLEKSRNVVTVRLAEMVGLDYIAETVKKFGLIENPVSNYALVLGADETTVLDVVTAYAMIANGGKRITPNFIEMVQDKQGKTLLRKSEVECKFCDFSKIKDGEENVPEINIEREQIVDEQTIFQASTFLQGVVQRGTAWRAKRLRQPIAGKTGTTNDSFDAWFVGFSPDLVVGVWAGFDNPKTLGKYETGSSVALPIFVDVMKQVQKELRPTGRVFKVPVGIKFAKIDRSTGKAPTPTSLKKNIIFEAFKSENFDKLFAKPEEGEEVVEEEAILY